LCLIILLRCSNASASTITPISAYSSSLSKISTTDADLLHVRSTASTNISINKFDNFEVTDKTLKLINVPRQMEGSNEKSAQLIVIVANNIVLNNKIELVGPASDILFISTGFSGSITCNSCELKNFHRITFATAVPILGIGDYASKISWLDTAPFGTVNINGLLAPGSIVLDVVTNTLSLNGEINLHQRAVKDSLGGYRQSDNGNYTIGTGSVNVLLGSARWDYETQKIVRLADSGAQNTLGGSIKAVAVKVTSPKGMTINTQIDTRTNLLSSVRHRDKMHVPDEGIVFQVMGGSTLAVNGSQYSNGDIALKGSADIFLSSSQTNINGREVSLVAGKAALNAANIEANSIKISVEDFQNEGSLKAIDSIEVQSEKHLLNQYGGLMTADVIKLQSIDGIVRNGSRTPYRSESVNNNLLLNLTRTYYSSINVAQLGSFYMPEFQIDTEASSGKTKAASTSANINARHIEITAKGFENINPYYKHIDSEDKIVLTRKQALKVNISAEDHLAIKTDNYILNSSARIAVNNRASKLLLSTEMLLNDRYRIANVIDKKSQTTEEVNEYDVGGATWTNEVDTEVTVLKTKTAVFSPPAVLLAMGDFQAEASATFFNNTGYVEIFGNAVFNTPELYDYGVAHSGKQRNQQIISVTGITGCLFWWCFPPNATIVQPRPEHIEMNPQEVDSLFFIHSNVLNINENVRKELFKNHLPYELFEKQAINNAALGAYGQSIGSEGFLAHNNTVYTNTVISSEVNGDVLTINSVTTDSYASNDQMQTVSDSQEFSLFDEIEKLYESLLNYFTELLNEIDWWSEE
jgi:hypothetical protein